MFMAVFNTLSGTTMLVTHKDNSLIRKRIKPIVILIWTSASASTKLNKETNHTHIHLSKHGARITYTIIIHLNTVKRGT